MMLVLFLFFGSSCSISLRRERVPLFSTTLKHVLRNYVRSLERLPMNSTAEGSIVFIIFVPVLWVLWLWVPAFAAGFSAF